jgi:Ulp1 protease family, C-terminal catalytic domain
LEDRKKTSFVTKQILILQLKLFLFPVVCDTSIGASSPTTCKKKVTVFDPLFRPNAAVKQKLKMLMDGYNQQYRVPKSAEIVFARHCQHQDPRTQNCGVYTMDFGEKLASHEKFDPLLNSKVRRLELRKLILRHVGGTEGSLQPTGRKAETVEKIEAPEKRTKKRKGGREQQNFDQNKRNKLMN